MFLVVLTCSAIVLFGEKRLSFLRVQTWTVISSSHMTCAECSYAPYYGLCIQTREISWQRTSWTHQYRRCKNYGIVILSIRCEWFFALRYKWHVTAGSFQLLANIRHKWPGNIKKRYPPTTSTSICLVNIAKITACLFISCISW